MNFGAEKLYNLLPSVYRIRDAEQGFPLKQLIGVIADQVAVLEENLDQLYDNQFVETAAPWALPYLGDLLGIHGLSSNKALTRAPRAEVGHTIAYRRRKGTAAMLEMLSHDVTGWPARAVECFARLAVTQNWNHLRRDCLAFAELRASDKLQYVSTPFDDIAHTVEVRRVQSGGEWNTPNIGIFLWRLRAYSLTRSPLQLVPSAVAGDELANQRYRLHPLGLDVNLFNRPITEDDCTHLAEPLNVPMPITCRAIRGDCFRGVEGADSPWKDASKRNFPWPNQFHPSREYYASGASILLERQRTSDEDGHTEHEFTPIQPDEIIVCDLGDKLGSDTTAWGHEQIAAASGKILLDPTRGRVVLPAELAADETLVATFHYGFSANLGGGEYDRSHSFSAERSNIVRVASDGSSSLTSVEAGVNSLLTMDGIVEIGDSGRYEESFSTVVWKDRRIEIRASDHHRPTLILVPSLDSNQDPILKIEGNVNSSVTLNGLMVAGRTLEVSGILGRLVLRHCTILAGLKINDATPFVEIDSCILGPIRVHPDAHVHLSNSIIDAGTVTAMALAGLGGGERAGLWQIKNCTIRGRVAVCVLELASNSIFLAARDEPGTSPPVHVQRCQQGCVRFCWLPPGSVTPRRYRCLPAEGTTDVLPQFTSLRYGDATYAQLAGFCDDAIKSGADDESEMGAFHDLFQRQRESYLRARLDEYLRFGLEAGVFYAT
jgi:hypothetical protein